jgi:hypothetical protein
MTLQARGILDRRLPEREFLKLIPAWTCHFDFHPCGSLQIKRAGMIVHPANSILLFISRLSNFISHIDHRRRIRSVRHYRLYPIEFALNDVCVQKHDLQFRINATGQGCLIPKIWKVRGFTRWLAGRGCRITRLLQQRRLQRML